MCAPKMILYLIWGGGGYHGVEASQLGSSMLSGLPSMMDLRGNIPRLLVPCASYDALCDEY